MNLLFRCLHFCSLLLLLTAPLACGPNPTDQPDPTACITLTGEDLHPDALTSSCLELTGSLLIIETDLTIEAGTTIYLEPDTELLVQARLRLLPGVTMIFGEGARMDVQGGLLEAVAAGEGEAPIRFVGSHDVPGHWQGLRLSDTPDGAVNRLVNVEIRHAGRAIWQDQRSVTQANLFVTSTGRLELRRAHIAQSAHHGLSVTGGTLFGCQDLSFDAIERHSLYADAGSDVCF